MCKSCLVKEERDNKTSSLTQLRACQSPSTQLSLRAVGFEVKALVFKIEALIRVSFWRVLSFQSFSWKIGSNPRRQSKNIEMKYQTHIKLGHGFYIIHVSKSIWRIKNQPFKSTSCSDNASCSGQFILKTSRDVFIFNLGLHFEGLFWERYILKGQITFEGHWRLQSWTLESMPEVWENGSGRDSNFKMFIVYM